MTGMTLTMILTTAYGAVGAMGVAAYLPQLLALVRDKGRSEHVPMATWVLWGIQTQVVTLYALLVNGDVAFLLVNLCSMVMCNTCLGVLLYNRYWKPVGTSLNVVVMGALQDTAVLETPHAA